MPSHSCCARQASSALTPVQHRYLKSTLLSAAGADIPAATLDRGKLELCNSVSNQSRIESPQVQSFAFGHAVSRRFSFVLLTGLGVVRNTRFLWANFLHPLMNLNILAGAGLQFGAEF